VRANLKLLPGLFIHVRPGEHGIPLDPGGQGNRPVNFGVGPLGRIDDLGGTLVQDRVIVGFHPNPNYFPRGSHDW
jgi:hypothetical protein